MRAVREYESCSSGGAPTRQNQAKAHTFALVSFTADVPERVVVVPTPTDPAGIRRCARDARTWSAAKNHTDEQRGSRRDPGVRQPGAGRGQLPALSRSARSPWFSIYDAALQVHN